MKLRKVSLTAVFATAICAAVTCVIPASPASADPTVSITITGKTNLVLRGDTGGYDTSDFNVPACWYVPYKNGEDFHSDILRVSRRDPVRPEVPQDVEDHVDDNGKWWLPDGIASAAGAACYNNLEPRVWVPDGDPPPPARITVQQLAYIARAAMRLTSPRLQANPRPPKRSYVGLGTWVWSAPEKKTREVTAQIPELNMSATVTATRTGLNLSPGTADASRYQLHPGSGQCTDLGVRYTGARRTPPCGVTYQRSSADQPGQEYSLTGSFTWNITWAGTGGSGTMPSRTLPDTITIRVGEVQTTN